MVKNSTIKVPEVAAHITRWLADYAGKAGVNGFVVGISGGVDSAVTSSLCAATGLTTHCIEMPIHQPPSHVSRAREHITLLQQRHSNVVPGIADLTPVFESFRQQVPANPATHVDLALANARARLRMTTLYYYAGLHGLLVAGTGNKIEDFGVGFFTKYGDGGVDLSPIADLMKSDVYALGEYLQIPESIMRAKPADGLFGDDRSDEDQLGASYAELEWAMQQTEDGKQPSDFEGRHKQVMQIYLKKNLANRHKMNPIPVCIIPVNLKI